MVVKQRDRLKRVREVAKLSQKALAEMVGTSQQQIQRVEVGHTLRLELATRIAAALRTDLETLFPEIRAVARKIRKETKNTKPLEHEHVERVQQDLAKVGIDADSATWTVILRMRSGLKRQYLVSSMDAERLQTCISNSGKGFMSFDSNDAEVVVGLDHMLSAHFLWDGPGIRDPLSEEQAPVIRVWFHHPEPVAYEVEYEEESAPDQEMGQIRDFLFGLDLGLDFEEEPFASFDDIDGERVYLRLADVEILEASFAIFSIPEYEDENDDRAPDPAAAAQSASA